MSEVGISRIGFVMTSVDTAERNGETFSAVPADKMAPQPGLCQSENKEQCAFYEEDCKGIPCLSIERRQWGGKGYVVWLKDKA